MSEEWKEYPTCPCCGTIDQDWHDGLPPKNDGDRWSATCCNCGNDYWVELNVTATFRTGLLLTETKEVEPKKEAKIIDENLLEFLKTDSVLQNQPYMCVYYDRQCPFAEELLCRGETFRESGNSDPSEWTYYCHLLKKEVWAEQAECTLLQMINGTA